MRCLAKRLVKTLKIHRELAVAAGIGESKFFDMCLDDVDGNLP